MTEDQPDVAHLTAESLDTYMAAGVPTTHVLSDSPRYELELDPAAQRYRLMTPVDGHEPAVAGYRRVSVETFSTEDGPWFQLEIDARDLHHEAYGMVVSIVSAVRGGATFATAVETVLERMRAVLASRRRLSPDQEIGLLGELLVVRHLLATCDGADVIDWWLGLLGEQHDLGLPDFDVEVKTTSAERRVHVVHGERQMEATPGRPLWLLSIQVTRAGGARGLGLPELVGDLRRRVPHTHRESLAVHLHGVGWREEDADLYPDRYILRSTPAAFEVDDDFPAITPARLSGVVPHLELISDLQYRLDLSARTPGDPGEPLATFLARQEITDV